MSNYSTYKGVNNITLDVATRDGTGSMLGPKGTTAQRPASPVVGYIRYNTTTDCYEQYTALGWAGIAAPPVITTISPTTFNGESGTTITVNGANFSAGSIVTFITNGGTPYNAGATTFVSSSQVTATTPQDFTVADEPIDVKITNANGLSTTLSDALDCGGSPTWTTAAGNILDTNETFAATVTIAATDPDAGSTIAYSVGSGSLPSGMSLNSSTGVISGTPAEIASDTTYSFNGVATDNAGNTATRSFNIIIRNVAPSIIISGTSYNLASSAQTFSTQGYYAFTANRSFQARLQLWGAGGGGANGNDGPSRGCAGGYVEGLYTFAPDVTYVMLIGQGGRRGSNPTGRAFPDGGQSQENEGYGQAGGGGSTRFGLYAQSGFNITNSSGNYNNTSAVYNLIAGAGAGGSDYIYGWSGTPAGFGGGTNGANGGSWYPSGESENSTGKGGTQSAGGAGGTTPARLAFSEAGAKYYGGNGSGSGGGGGYYGGGGARGYYSLGGGGSGFIGSGITSGTFYTTTSGQSTHYVSPDPRSNRPSNAGRGGDISTVGNDGAVIFTLV
jgi:hypothetical protein